MSDDPRINRIVEVLEARQPLTDESTIFDRREAARDILAALASQHVAAVLTAEDQATAIYQALMPMLAGIPIEPTSRALITHLAVMVDQTAPGLGEARKASIQIGESIWALILAMRAEQAKKQQAERGR